MLESQRAKRPTKSPQLAIIVNKVTLYGASESKNMLCSSLPSSVGHHSSTAHKHLALYLECSNSTPRYTDSIEALFIFFTLIDKCGKLLCLLQWAIINKRFLIKKKKKEREKKEEEQVCF